MQTVAPKPLSFHSPMRATTLGSIPYGKNKTAILTHGNEEGKGPGSKHLIGAAQ